MHAPATATIANDLQERIEGLIADATHYLSPFDRNLTRLKDELDVLGKADAGARSVLLSLIYGLCGDRVQCDYYLNNAERIHAPSEQIKLARITTLLNLGYSSEALDEMQRIDITEHGLPRRMMSNQPANGAFHTLDSLFERATRLQIPNLPDRTSISPVVEIMDSWGDTDQDYCAALDIAGEILREHKLFFIGNAEATAVHMPSDGSAGYVKLVYKVAVDADTSMDMTLDYVDRIARSGRKIPPSLVFEFEGTEEP